MDLSHATGENRHFAGQDILHDRNERLTVLVAAGGSATCRLFDLLAAKAMQFCKFRRRVVKQLGGPIEISKGLGPLLMERKELAAGEPGPGIR